jgi:hypothetical protein
MSSRQNQPNAGSRDRFVEQLRKPADFLRRGLDQIKAFYVTRNRKIFDAYAYEIYVRGYSWGFRAPDEKRTVADLVFPQLESSILV